MSKFFGRHGRSRRNNEKQKESLSDKTNFPLLSTKWMTMRSGQQQDTAASMSNFSSARRLLCFSDARQQSLSQGTNFPTEHVQPDPKAVSPPHDVASTWVQMGSSSDSSAVLSSCSSSLSSSVASASTSRKPTDRTENCGSSHIRDRATARSAFGVTTTASEPAKITATTTTAASRRRQVAAVASHRPHRLASRTISNMRQPKAVSKSTVQAEWRSAKDPKSGRTYYYNVKTRETQWRKPVELASPEERKAMAEKERKQKEFFAVMEANMLKQLATGQVPGTPKVVPSSTVTQETTPSSSTTSQHQTKSSRPQGGKLTIQKPRMVRTISAMDDQILRELVKRVPSINTTTKATKTTKMKHDDSIGMDELNKLHDEMHLSNISEESAMNMSVMEISLADLDVDVDGDNDMQIDSPSVSREESDALMQLAKTAEQMARTCDTAATRVSLSSSEKSNASEKKVTPTTALKKPVLDSRRNTCGTIYVGSTMSAPDKDATIKCVCGVYRAHILSAATERRSSFYFGGSDDDDKYRIFNDRERDRQPTRTLFGDVSMGDLSSSDEDAIKSVPSLDEITIFYRDVFRRAQMESDCIIMSLIYVERLIKNTNGGLRPRPSNWRSLLFSCMILSSKVWDDLSMWNADFSQTCPAGVRFSLQRINELELAVLNALDYKVKVPASEYAKYYFLLRSMLIKSGLGGDDIKTLTPLDVEGAKKLEQVSSSFQSTAATKRRVAQEDMLRSKSMGDVDVTQLMQGAQKSQDKKASLEHMVKM